jgi:hypothetical protein
MLSGMWQLMLAPLVGAVMTSGQQNSHRARLFIFASAILFVATASITANVICIEAFATPTNANWDPANTEAAQFAKHHEKDSFIITDWGMGMQVIAATKDHADIEDVWPSFMNQDGANSIIEKLKKEKDRDVYIYTRLPEFETFKGNRANLIAALDKNHVSYEVASTYPNWKGTPMIQIWKIRF